MKKIILALAFFLPASGVHALTVSQLNTEIRIAIRDNPTDTARQRYSDSTILNFMNEAQRDFVNNTWLSEKTTQYALAPQTTYYSLPQDVLAISQVYFTNTSNQLIELEEFLQKSLYDTYPSWDRSAGSPVEYWVSQATSAEPANAYPMRISYIPIPTRTSTGTVTVWYFSKINDLVNTADVPFDGRTQLRQYDMAIAYHVIMRIKVIEGKADEAQVYQSFYQNYVNVAKSNLGKAPNYSPSMGIGGSKH